MKRIYFIITGMIFVFLLAAFAHAEEKVPKPVGWVNDFAGVISPEYSSKMTAIIDELKSKTSVEVAVVTVDSIAPYDEKSYARLIFDDWKIGKKGKDNGVLVLLAVKERRWRIEAGYGIEGILPDGKCGEIGRNYMVPYFKQGDYGKGLYNGVSAIADILARGESGTRQVDNTDNFKAPFGLFIASLFLPALVGLFLIIISLFMTFFVLNMPFLAIVFLVIYIFTSLFRFTYWRNLPRDKRGNNFFMYGGGGSGGYGGGGFGGGGFGGGGFGGGGGGGGGAGGGF